MSDTELISDFTLTVGGKTLNTKCSMGNKACVGRDYVTLADSVADCVVTFTIATNKPDVISGGDVLRGDRTFDDVRFVSER